LPINKELWKKKLKETQNELKIKSREMEKLEKEIMGLEEKVNKIRLTIEKGKIVTGKVIKLKIFYEFGIYGAELGMISHIELNSKPVEFKVIREMIKNDEIALAKTTLYYFDSEEESEYEKINLEPKEIPRYLNDFPYGK